MSADKSGVGIIRAHSELLRRYHDLQAAHAKLREAALLVADCQSCNGCKHCADVLEEVLK